MTDSSTIPDLRAGIARWQLLKSDDYAEVTPNRSRGTKAMLTKKKTTNADTASNNGETVPAFRDNAEVKARIDAYTQQNLLKDLPEEQKQNALVRMGSKVLREIGFYKSRTQQQGGVKV